jgi:hypothetical protein
VAPLRALAETSDAVARGCGRLAKAELLAEWLRGLPVPEAAIAALYLTGKTPRGRLEVGPALVHAASD